MPALPIQGSTSWYPYAQALDSAARNAVPAAGDSTVLGVKTFNDGLTVTSTSSPLRSSTYFGLGAGVGSAQMPFYQNSLVNGSTIAAVNAIASGGGDDYVGHQINVKFEGGFSQLIQTRTGNMTSGSATLTLTSGTFASPITVGYQVSVPGAGPGGGILKARITAITDTTHATVSPAAGATVSGATVTASLAADPAFVFGANDFFTTGTVSGDLSGIKNMYGRLIETHVLSPGANLDVMKVLQVEGHLETEAVGGHIGTFFGLHVLAPRNGGTIDTAYGLYIDAPTTATTNYGLYVNGASPSYIGGLLKLSGDIQQTGTVFNVYAGASSTAGSRLQLRANSVDGFAYVHLPNPGAQLNVTDGTNNMIELHNNGEILAKRIFAAATNSSTPALIGRQVVSQSANIVEVQDYNTNPLWAVNPVGIPRWAAASIQQTTVGAAGGASALPATPTKYLKVVDSAGTTLVIPAYAA